MSTASPERFEREPVPTYGGKHELDKWNWGAFLWGFIWAFGHRLWAKGIIGLLLSIIPFGALFVAIWYGLKGNRWIWERGGYDSHEELRAKERRWAWAYLIFFVAWIALVVLLVAVGAA